MKISAEEVAVLHAEAVAEALTGAADSKASISSQLLHSLLAQYVIRENPFENAELREAITKFEEHKTPTFLPLLRAEEQTVPVDLALPISMAGGTTQASSLAGVLEDLGYGCTSSSAAFKDVLRQIGAIDEAAIASVLAMMMRTHSNLTDLHGTQVNFPPLQKLLIKI